MNRDAWQAVRWLICTVLSIPAAFLLVLLFTSWRPDLAVVFYSLLTAWALVASLASLGLMVRLLVCVFRKVARPPDPPPR